MNTNNIKKYAPQARREFIEAVGKRLNQFGVYTDKKGKALTISEPIVSGSVMQIDGNSFDAGLAQARKRLTSRAEKLGFDPLVEHVAYTWFNRLCAIRFMELKGDYLEHGLRVLSHPEKANGFELLDHAQDVAEDLGLDRNHIVELKLAGNKDEELYRHLLLGQCHKLHEAMLFLFEALDDETELLLPDNLTRTDSILRGLVDNIPEQDWQQVEIIGWLYQFYISEKKDQVIGNVVKSEDIPAATQLFTPNWIVKYLVQNSVGRQWLMTYPDSGLKALMEYYIEPAEQEASVTANLAMITPASIEPESIKVIDPACGSGHILVEAYEILKSIYEERGYRSRDIPKLILENNLVGLDIDDRAAQLAGFALMMKAREDDRRIFTRDIKLNVLALQSTQNLNLPELWRKLALNKDAKIGMTESIFDDAQTNLVDAVDDADFTALESVLALFEHAKTFGSLIHVPANKAEYLQDLKNQLQALTEQGDSYQKPAAAVLLPFVQQAWLLAQRYDAVIGNPPYMGTNGMSPDLKLFISANYNDAKVDLFSCFIDKAIILTKANKNMALVVQQSWMFLSSFEDFRKNVLSKINITSMSHIGYNSFPELNSKVVQCVSFSANKSNINNYIGTYYNLNSGHPSSNKSEAFLNINKKDIHMISQSEFEKIPGSTIAYWSSNNTRNAFQKFDKLSGIAKPRTGLNTGNNDYFLKYWHELDFSRISFNIVSIDSLIESKSKWIPYNKGGDFRRWYGNNELVVNWENNGKEIKDFALERNKGKHWSRFVQNTDFFFKEGICWSFINFSRFAVRYKPAGYIFDVQGTSAFPQKENIEEVMAILCSKVGYHFLSCLNPTLSFQAGNVSCVPYIQLNNRNIVKSLVQEAIEISKKDWDNYERSWDFLYPLVLYEHKHSGKARSFYNSYKEKCYCATKKLALIEAKINKEVISSYSLEDELSSSQNEDGITLFSNPFFRYGASEYDKSSDTRFQSDTITEWLSYSIGCMMGRYSLDRPGLVYALSSNEGFADLITEGAFITFPADDDGIIPLTDQEWFKDDATNRFRDFVRTVWGEEDLPLNLDFVAESLCLNALKPKKSESSLETVRRYLSTQFYKDHLKTYKKRPIYWLFSSGKQKAFECLVYLHRYNESTLSRMRTEYVTPLLGKYDSFADQLNKQIEDATTSEGTQLKKELVALEKKQTELREFDDKLKHYADMRIKLDLDDGVKMNYGKFGDLLVDVKAVTGGKE